LHAAALIFESEQLLATKPTFFDSLPHAEQLRIVSMLCSRIGPQIWGIPCDSVPFLLPPPEMSETQTGTQVLDKLKEYRILAKSCAAQQDVFDDKGQAEDAKLLGKLVCVKISIVRARGLWHILRLAMRLYFHSLSSEAIAEFAGSVMRYLEKRHAVGNPPSTATLIRAVRLRAAGVRGDVGDMCFVHRAMEYHFGKCMLHRVRFFVTSRILASRQAEDEAAEWEDAKWLGSSKVISTIRKKIGMQSHAFSSGCRTLAASRLTISPNNYHPHCFATTTVVDFIIPMSWMIQHGSS
jgi:hypothetical protein